MRASLVPMSMLLLTAVLTVIIPAGHGLGKEPDPCKAQPCHLHATCTKKKKCPRSLPFMKPKPCKHYRTCKCNTGFTGSGVSCRVPNAYKLPKVEQCQSSPGPQLRHRPPNRCTHCWCMTRFWKYGNPMEGCSKCYDQARLDAVWQPDCREPECPDKPLPCKTWSNPYPLQLPPLSGTEETLHLYLKPSLHNEAGVYTPFAKPFQASDVGTPSQCRRCPDCLCYPVFVPPQNASQLFKAHPAHSGPVAQSLPGFANNTNGQPGGGHGNALTSGPLVPAIFCPPPLRVSIKSVHGQTWQATFHGCELVSASLALFVESVTGLSPSMQTLSMNGHALSDPTEGTLFQNGITHESVVWVQRRWTVAEVDEVRKECQKFVQEVAPSRMGVDLDRKVKNGESSAVRVERHAMCPRYILDGHAGAKVSEFGGWGLNHEPQCAFVFCSDLGCCDSTSDSEARPWSRVNMRLPRNRLVGLTEWWNGQSVADTPPNTTQYEADAAAAELEGNSATASKIRDDLQKALQAYWHPTSGKNQGENIDTALARKAAESVYSDARLGTYRTEKGKKSGSRRGVCPERNEAPPKSCAAHWRAPPEGRYSNIFLRKHPLPKYRKADCECLNVPGSDTVCFSGETGKCEDPPLPPPPPPPSTSQDNGAPETPHDPCGPEETEPKGKDPKEKKERPESCPPPVVPPGADDSPPPLKLDRLVATDPNAQSFLNDGKDGTRVYKGEILLSPPSDNLEPDGRHNLMRSEQACATACSAAADANPPCVAWVFDWRKLSVSGKGECWMKKSVPPPWVPGGGRQKMYGVTTGVRAVQHNAYCQVVNDIAEADSELTDHEAGATYPGGGGDPWLSVNRDPWRRQRLAAGDVASARGTQPKVFLGGYGE